MAASNAPILWAQRKDSIYVTINVPDVDAKAATIKLTGDKLVFSGKSNGKDYAVDVDFFAAVDPEDAESKFSVKPRSIHFHIVKKDKDADYWPRLVKDKAKEKSQVAIDWTRYVDEDEEKAGFDKSALGGAQSFGGEDDGGMGGLGGGMPGGFGGMPGMGGGAGGMDFAAMMKQMQAGGMGGAGGLGGMDFGGLGGAGGGDEDDEEDGEHDHSGHGHSHGPGGHSHGGAEEDDGEGDLPDLAELPAPATAEENKA